MLLLTRAYIAFEDREHPVRMQGISTSYIVDFQDRIKLLLQIVRKTIQLRQFTIVNKQNKGSFLSLLVFVLYLNKESGN
jgi:chromatin segregation and condensation protein Rec8/ScpA/Scc1 (kleisin family)